MTGDNYVDTSGYGKIWKVKPATVRYWIYCGYLPEAKQDEPNHPWRIPRNAIPKHKEKRGYKK